MRSFSQEVRGRIRRSIAWGAKGFKYEVGGKRESRGDGFGWRDSDGSDLNARSDE